MRILFTSDPEIPVPPELYGGVQRLVGSLVKGMRERGHIVGLVAHADSTASVDNFFPFPGIESQNDFDTIRNTKALWSAAKRFKPDVLHSFSRLMYMLPLFPSSLPKIMSYERRPSYSQVKRASRLAGTHLTFTACSQHICESGKAAGGSWQTIYNFVELEQFTFQPKVSENAPLVFLSRVERIKGAHTAIEIARRTGRRLLIAGNHSTSGEDGNYWNEEILPHLGREGIEYVGAVNDAQKNELLGKAAAMLVPIEWEEPFGIVFAESLACGTPVITCPMGAAPEIVRHGIDGFLITSIEEGCDAVERLAEINRLDCRRRVEECFSADIIVAQYEQLYHQLLEGTKRTLSASVS